VRVTGPASPVASLRGRVGVQEPSDHLLVGGEVLLGLLFEELYALHAQGDRHLDGIVPVHQLFRRRQKVGTTFTGPIGSSLYFVFLLIDAFPLAPVARPKDPDDAPALSFYGDIWLWLPPTLTDQTKYGRRSRRTRREARCPPNASQKPERK
jgi:hypothetical protein